MPGVEERHRLLGERHRIAFEARRAHRRTAARFEHGTDRGIAPLDEVGHPQARRAVQVGVTGAPRGGKTQAERRIDVVAGQILTDLVGRAVGVGAARGAAFAGAADRVTRAPTEIKVNGFTVLSMHLEKTVCVDYALERRVLRLRWISVKLRGLTSIRGPPSFFRRKRGGHS